MSIPQVQIQIWSDSWPTRHKSQTIELPSSHGLLLSHPKEVAALIEKAGKHGI